MEEASGQDLKWFFRQWIHTTNTLDYAVTNVETQQTSANSWRTRVEITRNGEVWMPIDLKVGNKVTRIESRDRVYNAFVETGEKPAEVVLDPDGALIDTARQNNTRTVQ
jgi:aminopeptidase N